MSCLKCNAVAIPDMLRCPSCLPGQHVGKLFLGIQDEEIPLDVVVRKYPNISWLPNSDNDRIDDFAFYLTDFDDLAIIRKSDGQPYVYVELLDGHGWDLWDEYVASI